MFLRVPLVMALFGFLSLTASLADQAAFPFYVYKDKGFRFNHYVASGFMPDGRCVAINDAWTDNCGGSESCIQNTFDRDCSAIGVGWAGIFWLQPANNWGDEKGGFNLTGAKKLVFWARGDKGGEVVSFKMGGVGMGHQYPDSDSASSDPITLTKDWKEYSIDLSGKDLSIISGGFAWVGTVKENQSNIIFYLRDIYYE
jgi:hypothetical protein